MQAMLSCYHAAVARSQSFSGIAPLLLRLYLAPVLAQAGWNKYLHFDNTVAWFGNADWGLGLPLPSLMAVLAIAAELGGAVLLALGLLTRLVSIPLLITMLVAIFAVHWPNGWLAIADSSSWLANERVVNSAQQLNAAKSLLQQHGNYDWLTSNGNFVVLNNGIEFAATYFVMLLSLLFSGGGRYTSLDFWLWRQRARGVAA
ncbi:MAG: DoxX family protein [Gammaproteobacteria bacterium]|nr:DoxX family protein [Gammaproteobacteria bacterium]MBU1555239.1 DoxX family protein [Gammaproteobacteria bacterium]MBU2071412.1 DoxX family protein [Gammaproteobacteria bacterium]MBU2182424.1 DoxX family protein [Gammaproteobacteria bacterium]MBU2204162.1 DoxX family protein [Gammaproteobacteria bacterium]